ncbi:hypothetical protein [Ornithinimicrobium cavernae]|uniref:hypothetical protein n=1 Tax=Ornithinimicrobium cavernae TaxID=2666047 RepID=UPI000D69C98E|nr:hypothetical protein [Ornithinimicrobium cavernae]
MGPVGESVTGEIQEWSGRWHRTGAQISLAVTDGTRCLVTKPGGELGVDLQTGVCADLEHDLARSSIVRVILTPDDEVLVVHVLSGF